MAKYDPAITVCSRCLRACCWQGEFMCDEAYEASTVERKVSTLIRISPKLDEIHSSEHPDYWNEHLWMANEPLLTVNDLKALGATGDSLELKDFEKEND